MTTLPAHLPILRQRIPQGGFPSTYDEPELTRAVDLCDARGRLNPAARGWSRVPLVRGNLSRHWPRKKRWNFWNWIGPDFVLSATLANIDYAAFCEIAFTDFSTRETIGAFAPAWPGSIALPEQVDESVAFRGREIDYRNAVASDERQITIRATARGGIPITADLVVQRPLGHETLNVVVPWTEDRFQLNSKSNTEPTAGTIVVGGRRYRAQIDDCHAVQDFGRGIWPHRSFWNWGVATGVQDGLSIGVNMGARWTTGTGANENGLCIEGRLYKVMEDLRWEYDAGNWMRPWRVSAPSSRMIDLELEPVVARTSNLNAGLLRTSGVCCFGTWRGTVRFGGRELAIRSLIGWAEEFDHRW